MRKKRVGTRAVYGNHGKLLVQLKLSLNQKNSYWTNGGSYSEVPIFE
jgi:hypothetical protein